jgi:hypothetical protein
MFRFASERNTHFFFVPSVLPTITKGSFAAVSLWCVRDVGVSPLKRVPTLP